MKRFSLFPFRIFAERAYSDLTRLPYDWVNQASPERLGYFARMSIVKRYLHLSLMLYMYRQKSRMLRSIPSGARVLFVYHGVTNFGDAIMDLGGRVLLDRTHRLDLFISDELAPLFREDKHLGKIFTSIEEIDPRCYQFVILNNLGLRNLRFKFRYFRKLPFAATSGFCHNIDYNHIELGFAAIADLFNLPIERDQIKRIAKPYIFPRGIELTDVVQNSRSLKIAIGLGGRDSRRTYAHWEQLFALFSGNPYFRERVRFVLLGTGDIHLVEMSSRLAASKEVSVISRINDCPSFYDNSVYLKGLDLYIGADGGLMHLAHALGVPSVSLFDCSVNPIMRITESCNSKPIVASDTVSDILPSTIYSAVVDFINDLAP
jgi:hypothetical protein